MTETDNSRTEQSPAAFVHTASPWVAALGLLLVALGILAITHPAFTAIATGVVIAYTLVLAGFLSLAAIAGDRSASGRVTHAAFGFLGLVAGAFVMFAPTAGAVELVWLIGAMFVASGLFDLLSARRGASRQTFMLLLGFANIAIGIYALLLVPADAIEVLALLVGISLVMRGCILMVIALWARRATS